MAGVIWEKRLITSVHQRYLRTWPVTCGTSCAAETIAPDVTLEEKVVELLDGYSGIFQAQFAGDYLIDLNPRPYGSLPLAVAAGRNLVGIYCDLLEGKRPASVARAADGKQAPMLPLRARTGVFYRWIEGDIRSLWTAYRAGEVSPASSLRALRPQHRAAHSVESLKDPLPILVRGWSALRRE